MNGLLYRVRVAVLAHAFAYIPLALWLAYEDHAGITFLIISPLGFSFAVIWLGWRCWAALGDAHAILTRWLVRRRPDPLDNYMLGIPLDAYRIDVRPVDRAA